MRPLRRLLALCLLCAAVLHAEPAGVVYELRTYTTEPGRLEALLARFRDHTLGLFARHGLTSLGYWVPLDPQGGAGRTLVYLLAFPNRAAATKAWQEFRADPEWQAVRQASEAEGKIVAKVESVFVAPTDYSPSFKATQTVPPQIFELRTYTTQGGGLPALDARFRGGETDLFASAGMTGVFFAHPLDLDQGAGHTLIYLLSHASREAATRSWQQFRVDPVWVRMKADSEKAAGGPLTVKTESIFLAPVDFSPTRRRWTMGNCPIAHAWPRAGGTVPTKFGGSP